MAIKNDVKLIQHAAMQKLLLRDLANDPLEMQDLAKNPASKEKVKTLFAGLLKLQAENGDQLDLKNVRQVG